MEKELQKMKLKNEYRDAKLRGEAPFFIDTLSKS